VVSVMAAYQPVCKRAVHGRGRHCSAFLYRVPQCSLSQTARHTIHTTAWNTFYQHCWTFNDVFLL